MNKHRVILLFSVLALIIVAEIFILVRCSGNKNQQSDALVVSETFAPAATPEPTPELTPEPTATPVPTATPELTPVPTATPAPQTPSPTPSPAPTQAPGEVISSGSFQSDTGTGLNLLINWTTYADASGNTVVALTGSLESYSISVSARTPGITVFFGGQTVTFNTPAVSVEDGYAVTALFSGSMTVPSGTSGTITVSYDLRGSYSGVELPTVDCSGEVTG